MSKVLVTDSNLTNIANSIRTKLGVQTTYKPGQMSSAIDSIQTGFDIDGVIEEYQAAVGSNVSAGDFVTFVNTQVGAVSDTLLEETTCLNKKAVRLSNTSVFITYLASSTGYIHGAVCTISGTTITVGAVTTLVPFNVNYSYDVVALSSSSTSNASAVFITHASAGSSERYLYGKVCTISGTTITVGTDTQLSTKQYSGNNASVVALSSTKVFAVHNDDSGATTKSAVVCTISGTSITVGTDTQIVSTTTGSSTQIAMLSATKVLIMYASDTTSNAYFAGKLCTISGNSITAGAEKQLTSSLLNRGDIVALSSTSAFIAYYSNSASKPYIYGVVCTIPSIGTTITVGTETQLAPITGGDGYLYTMSLVAISRTKVFLAHTPSRDRDKYINGMFCTISGTTITAGEDVSLVSSETVGSYFSAVSLGNNKIFLGYSFSSNGYLRGLIADTVLIGKVNSGADTILGVAKTSGTDQEIVEVYVPDV